MTSPSQLCTPENGLKAWESIRVTIGRLDTLVMTLLTQGTVLLFVALGLIFGVREALGNTITFLLSLLLLFGTLFLLAGIVRYTVSITTAVDCAKKLEQELFGVSGSDQLNPRCITHHLAKHPLAASQLLGRLYYRVWGGFLVAVAFVFVVVQSVLMWSP
jgi:hypothetical protein